MKKQCVVVFAIFCVIAFCMAPAAASAGDSEKKISDNIMVSPLVLPIYETKSSLTGAIVSGQTKTYTYVVPSGDTQMDVQLSWKSSSNSLALSLTSPSGRTYGEYNDNYESSTPNARIPVHLEASSGTLPSGTWTISVIGKSVSGSESFTLVVNTYN
ncbi:MAG: hypothetical protein O0X93_03000 [Methanocorpusculum sp.]|nr:hypothetical protein [Methanocorpusculum sp.]MDE2522115.1 hypothetical protein [Methanocorpusculum sp.]MDE2524311.1 hypothetical protein [Methanocorpusculum sp.]